jgi:hypothetical protein
MGRQNYHGLNSPIMRHQLDAELLPIMAALNERAAGAPPRKRGDWSPPRDRKVRQ